MKIIFKMVLSHPKQTLLFENSVFNDCSLKISTINLELIFNNIKIYVIKYRENVRCS